MVIQCSTFGEAKGILASKGVSFDRAITDDLPRFDFRAGRVMGDGIHVYFMVGGADVAYYTPLMRALHVHDEGPRPWHPDVLEGTHEYVG